MLRLFLVLAQISLGGFLLVTGVPCQLHIFLWGLPWHGATGELKGLCALPVSWNIKGGNKESVRKYLFMLRIWSFYGEWTSFPKARQKKRWVSEPFWLWGKTHGIWKVSSRFPGFAGSIYAESMWKDHAMYKKMGIQTWKPGRFK